jgi:integrase
MRGTLDTPKGDTPVALTDTKVRSVKSREKSFKIADGKGLFLVVQPNGSKYWRFRYRFGGKEKLLAIGIYPDVTLADARRKRDDARKLLADDTDPGMAKQLKKRAKKLVSENSFEAITREWHIKFSSKWTPEHGAKILIRLEKDIFPWLGHRPITEITAPELLAVLRRIENRGAIETAHRTLQNCGQIFRYAIATGRAERDVSADLRGAIPPVKKRHLASITDPKSIGNLLRALNDYNGHFVTKSALQLAPLVFVRPGELRKAEWSEFNFETAEWRIPPEKMKMRITHIVPLSTQAVAILREIQALTGDGKYVFPSLRTHTRPMSNNAVLGALRRLGYAKDEMTGHGFRSMASTLLNEQGWNRDAIERQLAHAERNNIRAAYNYAEYLPERRKMMQHWADYLDALINNTNIASKQFIS